MTPRNTAAGILLCLIFLYHSLYARQGDQKQLLNKVQKIMLPPAPDDAAFTIPISEIPVIIATATEKEIKQHLPVIVTSRLGKGRILITGSDQYFKKPLSNDKNIQQLLQNAIAWAANTKGNTIQLWGSNMDLPAFPKGYKSITDTVSIHPAAGIIIITQDVTDSVKINSLEAFVRKGGSLIFGSPVAGMLNQQKVTYFEMGLNQLFRKAGMFHISSTAKPDDKKGWLTTNPIPAYVHITSLLNEFKTPGFIPPTAEADSYSSTIANYLFNNPGTSAISNKIRALFETSQAPVIPSPQHPVSKNDVKSMLIYRVQNYLATQRQQSHPDTGYIHPASRIFPGEVSKTAPRVNEQIVIPIKTGAQGLLEPDGIFYRWHSTGLYVAAGDTVTVTIPANCIPLHLKAQIGVHEDDLSHMTYFTRHIDNLTRTFELEQMVTTIFSPFGGLLMINIPDTSSLKTLTVKVKGAVKSPYFKQGVTSLDDWQKTIRQYPGPWAELATDKIILTVPSYRIRQLDDPGKLLQFWDEVMDADAKLADIAPDRVHPERIIIDQQVAFGYMYTAPYKIMAPDDESCALMLDEQQLRAKGSWGHFHELGHRHQFWGIDFNGLGEVTVNLYTMYVYDHVLHKGLYNHENISGKQAVMDDIRKYMKEQPGFDKFCEDPFLALKMYIELIEGFGWQPIETVFKKYRALPASQYPVTEEDKRDYWFTAICAATQKNLSLFFEKWQVPVRETAKSSVSNYPPWLPEELK
ncbi:M60 family metallopeptidase [Chitinophaga polysaccharea]|uniref:M60 family metallopeptidase n=1 Tax=Chitinophaga polysaccharea TaxID=1293035 RepID=UPI00115BBC1B|nr:M60 family metallopeptidase [Chitinophaga polysaccharea]